MAVAKPNGFLQAALGPPSFAQLPGFSSSASSSAGPSSAQGGWQQTGAISFGGSGTGGATVGGAAADMGLSGGINLGGALSQYWPVLLAVGVVWIARGRKSR